MSHVAYMEQAIALAARGRCTVSPNPLVGAVIVKNDTIIASGWHERAGSDHAEIMALRALEEGIDLHDATLYVTLEPCAHYGRTPPCVNAIIASGFTHVVVACLDPNPLVNGEGVRLLQDAGIHVTVGILSEKAMAQNRIFILNMQKQRPFVIGKWAMSLNGRTTSGLPDDRQFSGETANRETHELRQSVDAILIGANTARNDNPLLTVRDVPHVHKQPIRIIVSTRAKFPLDLRLFQTTATAETWLVTGCALSSSQKAALMSEGVVIIDHAVSQTGHLDAKTILQLLWDRGIRSVLLEGGMTLASHFIREGFMDELQVVMTPYLVVDQAKKIFAPITMVTQEGPDYRIFVKSGVTDV